VGIDKPTAPDGKRSGNSAQAAHLKKRQIRNGFCLLQDTTGVSYPSRSQNNSNDVPDLQRPFILLSNATPGGERSVAARDAAGRRHKEMNFDEAK
jgi:hypothetical protein